MSGILEAIYCWLSEFFPSFNAWAVNAWDGLLAVSDSLLTSFPAMTIGAIDPNYTWMLGVCGASQAISIIAGAMLTRFLLQSIPFVRWGS